MKNTFSKLIIAKIKLAPTDSGCYIFRDKKDRVLYVGKANNLRQRLKSYLKIIDFKTQSLHQEAAKLEYIILRSEIEALITESQLIQKLKPIYNVLWRDDKSYLYVVFSKDKFPKISIIHRSFRQPTSQIISIGPFTDSASLRLALKIIRRYFPYCTCKQSHLRDCLNAQMGRCLNCCCKKDSTIPITFYGRSLDRCYRQYQGNISVIKMILRGQSKKLISILKDEKERAALERIFEHKNYLTDPKPRIYSNLQKNSSGHSDAFVDLNRVFRVECYDISNFAGKEAVGAMTALVKTGSEWVPNKSGYRKFIIKSAPKRDDPRMIGEILTRRLKHAEWLYPDLIIIDGGLTQFRSAKKTLLTIPHTLNPISLISLAKPQKFVYGLQPNDRPVELGKLSREFQQLIGKAIYYTHNFVIRYHRQVRRRNFMN
ncbi:MAG: GIY-YIG nuclease family protein [bacterium]|nr:GIY-YIG nuclease family protein [bacterium]